MALEHSEVKIGGIGFHALMSEDKTFTSTVPSYPVDDGFTVQDTIINQPVELNMTLIVSATPVSHRSGSFVTSGLANKASALYGRINELHELWKSRKIVSVVTPEKTYKNMAIKSMRISHNPEDGYSREVSITLTEIRTATRSYMSEIVASGETEKYNGYAATEDKTLVVVDPSTTLPTVLPGVVSPDDFLKKGAYDFDDALYVDAGSAKKVSLIKVPSLYPTASKEAETAVTAGIATAAALTGGVRGVGNVLKNKVLEGGGQVGE